MYTSRHLATLFDVTVETIRLWTIEFAAYLSPTAQPVPNKTRQYTQDDLEVLTLVAKLKSEGSTFADIHANLKSGQRGTATVRNPEEISQISTASREQRLVLEVERLQRLMVQMQQELETQRQIAEQVTTTREENVRLQARLENSQRERERLEQQVKELADRIEYLAREAGREYAKGFVDAIREKSPEQP
jgi:DNA-binding transcriptional MerR regulator